MKFRMKAVLMTAALLAAAVLSPLAGLEEERRQRVVWEPGHPGLASWAIACRAYGTGGLA